MFELLSLLISAILFFLGVFFLIEVPVSLSWINKKLKTVSDDLEEATRQNAESARMLAAAITSLSSASKPSQEQKELPVSTTEKPVSETDAQSKNFIEDYCARNGISHK